VIFAAHAGIDELNDDFLTNVFQVAIAPGFKRGTLRSGRPALILGPVIGATGGVGFNLVGLAIHDVHLAAVRLPSGTPPESVR